MTDEQFNKWCVSLKDVGHEVQLGSATARQRKLGWDAAMAHCPCRGWLAYPENKPDDDEPLLVAALTTDQKSVVQFAKYHDCQECGKIWELYEDLGEAVITHFMRIPALPAIHYVKTDSIN